MSVPFSRTLRSLQQDSYRFDLVVLSVLLSLIALWSAWFLTAPVAMTVTSNDLTVDRNGILQVNFPAQALAQLRAGQSAEVVQQDSPQLLRRFRGEVLQLPRATNTATAVYVFLTPEQPVLAHDLPTTVTVRVGERTPAQLIRQIIERPAGEP